MRARVKSVVEKFSTAYMQVMVEPVEDARAAALSRILWRVLRPLVRALIAHGVTAPALYRMIKRIYVDVARQEFGLDGKTPTDSRVAMLTGVHRRDIRMLREGSVEEAGQVRQKVTTLASVLGRWLADPETTDERGRPISLPRTATEGPSFETLVQAVSLDIRPRTVLDELLRQGLVSLEEDGEVVRLAAEAVLGRPESDEKVHFFAENVGDHAAAAVDNLLSDPPRFYERAVYYNRLRPSSVETIERRARALATETLIELNRLAHERQQADLDAPDGTERFRFGMFFFHESEDEDQSESGERPNDRQ